MAKKPDITTIASGYYSRQALNTNFTNLQNGFDNTLSLDGSTPNSMGADFDVNGNNILNAGQVDVDSLYINGVSLVPGDANLQTTYLTASYTGDGSTVAYALTANPQTEANTSVYVDGVYQNKATYSLSGTTVTFSEAPPLNAAIEIVYPTNTDTLNGSDASAITYNQGGTGAQDRNVAQKLQETVSIKDFGAVGDGVTDDTAALNAAFSEAASSGHVLVGVAGTYRCTSSIILKSNLTYKGDHSAIFVQDYEYVVGPKQESLFVNENYDNNSGLDKNIHLDGLNITNDAAITTGSFISINRCENYSITNLKAVKTSANGTLNINGKNILLDNIYIDSLAPSGLNSDGIHFEYIEDAVLSNLIISAQDDCLGFAYFPIISGNPNNGPAGRDTPSKNITVTNAVLSSDIANGIRVGNTTLLGLATDNLISPAARYESMTFSNIVFNKVGATGSCISMYEIRNNMDFPNNEIRFNNCIINDTTSTTQSLIRIFGNDYLTGGSSYAAEGSVRNYDRIYFNGISGRHSNAGQTINAGGVKYLSLNGFEVNRTNNADNEIITNLVDDIYIKSSVIESIMASGTSNTLYHIDFDKLRIDGTDILGNTGGNAAVLISRPNKGNGGELIITGCSFGEQSAGVKAVSSIILDKIVIDADISNLTGAFRNSNLQATVDDIDQMTSLNANIGTVLMNEVRRTNNIAVLNMIFQVTSTIASGQTLAQFPAGAVPANANAVRTFISDNSGSQFQVDYSSGANLRSQSSIASGTYYLTVSYQTGV